MAHATVVEANSDAGGAQKLGPNEQAILNNIPIPLLRALVKALVLAKMRLQFTGWLQYVLPLVVAFFVFLVAGIALLLRFVPVANLLTLVGALLLVVAFFDVITVKYKIRLPEPLPNSHSRLGIFDLMRARRSCRSFQTRKLTPSHHAQLMASVREHCAASRINAAALRLEYIAAPLSVWPTVNASEFLVAIAPRQYNRYAVIEVGRTLQKVVMDATRMGLATCWIGPGADQSSIRQHLGGRFNPDTDHIVCVCGVGYRSGYVPLFLRIFNWQFKRRLPLSSLFFANAQFSEPLATDAPPFSQFGRAFEVCQWAPSSYNGQTTRCVAIAKPDDDTPLRLDFYASTASRYYAAVAVGIWCANWKLGCQALGIDGRFAVLSATERGLDPNREDVETQLPRYDVSWLMA